MDSYQVAALIRALYEAFRGLLNFIMCFQDATCILKPANLQKTPRTLDRDVG